MTIMQTRRITLTRTNNKLCVKGQGGKKITLSFTSTSLANQAQAELEAFVANNPGRGICSPQMEALTVSLAMWAV